MRGLLGRNRAVNKFESSRAGETWYGSEDVSKRVTPVSCSSRDMTQDLKRRKEEKREKRSQAVDEADKC